MFQKLQSRLGKWSLFGVRSGALILTIIAVLPLFGPVQAAEPAADPLAVWREGVQVRPVSDLPNRHSIHSYYVCNPESPDGKQIVYYTSTAANGHEGEICVLNRASGSERVVAKNVHTEDAHRAACQQWTLGGRSVAYHDVRGRRWLVAAVDVETLKERVLAENRQLAFGQGSGDLLPVYGCHWNPGEHVDLELINAATGDIRTAVTAKAMHELYGEWLQKEFGDKAQQTSIFFPVMSPDQKRVFFKVAAGSGGDNFMSKAASHRQGLIGFDLASNMFTFMKPKWGHPAWHPDSRQVIEVGNFLINSDGGEAKRIANLPVLRGCHLAVSPDGKLFVTDGMLESLGGQPGEWGIVVCDIRGGQFQIVHRFNNSHGAKSWRVSHPHPVFSADSRRIYFNVSSGDWTQLFVAEAGKPKQVAAQSNQ